MSRRLHPWFPHQFRVLALILTGLLVSPLALPAQDLAHRLILKDGSYQLVTKYEIKGDRVRYMSAERDDWEELPTSLVDWPATEKYEKDRAAGSAVPEAAQLDNFQGEPQIVEVQQSASDVARNTKANILRGAINPVAGIKQSIQLDGAHAAVQAHVDVPTLYIKIDDDPDQPAAKDTPRSSPGPQQPQAPQQPVAAVVPFDRFRIVRTEVKSDRRIVGDVKRQVSGKISQEQHVVKTTITRVTGGWLKLTPTENLTPGEYALVEMSGQEGMIGKEGMNLFVWDFGVNPKAPANPNPWKPTAPEAKPDPASKPAAPTSAPKSQPSPEPNLEFVRKPN
jgi:hypothetical protein